MHSNQRSRSRRGFLKHGAAVAGLALGGVPSASGQTAASSPAETASKSLKELIAYGERSRYVTSMRVPVAERMSPDMFGLTFKNGVIREDDVMDAHSLPEVVMPNRNGFSLPPEEWKHGKPRLQDYPKPRQ